MKILLVTNKVKTYALGFRNVIESLTALGHQVIWAADFSGFTEDKSKLPVKTVQIPIHSNPLKMTNLRALKRLKQVIEEDKIEAVHCSTPIGGALARLAAKQKKVPLVIYAAHGFLFYKGAPLLGRTLYKWQEQWMARWTDVLITITREDYAAAEKFKLRRGGSTYLVHGAGVEVGKTVCVHKAQMRKDLQIPEEAFVMLSAGFLNKNKNNQVLIRAMGKVKNPDLHYLICGEGAEKERLQKLAAALGVEENVHFLGYRTDLARIMAVSDLFIMPSYREGVPRALLEAMDMGLPCAGADTRGIRELLHKEMLCHPKDADAFAKLIRRALAEDAIFVEQIQRNRETAKLYSAERVREELENIYREVL